MIPSSLQRYFAFWPYFLSAFLFALLSTPYFARLASKYRIMDFPGSMRKQIGRFRNPHDDPTRHTHTHPIPFFGGLAVVIPVVFYIATQVGKIPDMLPLFLGLMLLIGMGVVDDQINLRAKYQFIIQFLASLLIVATDFSFQIDRVPFFKDLNTELLNFAHQIGNIHIVLTFPGDLILLFIILYTINSIKMIAGSDALLEGNMIIAFLIIFVISLRDPSLHAVSAISILTVGAMMGYIIYNLPPAKVYTGATGKSTYGFLLITLAILAHVKLATALLIVLLPLTDYFFVLVRRIYIYRPKSFVQLMQINGTDHLHHQLRKLGLSPAQVLSVEMAISLLIGALAILTTGASHLFILSAVMGILFAIIGLLHVKTNLAERTSRHPTIKNNDETPESRYAY